MGKQYPNEEKSNLIKNWKQSDLSKSQFCKKHKISLTTLHRWVKEYPSSVSKMKPISKEVSFIEVQPAKELPRSYNSLMKLTITTSNGTRMEFEL